MDKSHDILVNNLIQRLDELKILLSDVLIENAENLEDIVDYIAIMISVAMEEIYELAWYGELDTAGIGDDIRPTERQIQDCINQPVGDMTLIERISGYIAETDNEVPISTIIDKIKAAVDDDGFRVYENAVLECGLALDDEGYIVTKTWNAIIDEVTRETHFELNGTTIPVDEYFVTSGGAAALAPKMFGVPSEDIHCRCIITLNVSGG